MNHTIFSIVFAINFVAVYEVIPHKLHSGVRFETSGAKGTCGCPLAGSPSPAPLGREINWPLYYREPRHKSRVLIVSAPVGGRRRARGQNPLAIIAKVARDRAGGGDAEEKKSVYLPNAVAVPTDYCNLQ